MRFVIYRNSFLATVCSMFGATFVATAVASILSGGMGVLEAVGVLAVGLFFMWLGSVISRKKAERKQKKQQKA